MIKKLLLLTTYVLCLISCETLEDENLDISITKVELENKKINKNGNLQPIVSIFNNNNSNSNKSFKIEFFLSEFPELNGTEYLIGFLESNQIINGNETVTFTETFSSFDIEAGEYYLILKLTSDSIPIEKIFVTDYLITLTENSFETEIPRDIISSVSLFEDDDLEIKSINDEFIFPGDLVTLNDGTKISLGGNNILNIDPLDGNLDPITFTYTTDNKVTGVLSNPIDVIITIIDTAPPIATDDYYEFNATDIISINVLDNDVDPNGNDAALKIVSVNGEQATMAGSDEFILDDGSKIIFDPIGNLEIILSEDYNETLIFSYTIEDTEGLTDEGLVTVNITPSINEGKDLITSIVNLNSSSYTRLSSLEASVSITNIGTVNVDNFNVTNLYLSADKSLNKDEDFYIGFVSVSGGILANQTLQLQLAGGANQFGIDADAGMYYVIANTDYRSEVEEVNEENNIYVSDYQVEIFANDTDIIPDPTNPGLLSYTYENRYGEIQDELQLFATVNFVNLGIDNFKSCNYEYYASSSDVYNENEVYKVDFVKYMGFNWAQSASSTDHLGNYSELEGQYLYVKILDTGQEIRILDKNLNNNIVKIGLIQQTP